MAGTLSATITPATVVENVTAAFTATGTLDVPSGVITVMAASANLTGTGALAATAVAGFASTAALSGTGTLAATSTFNMASAAAFTSAGTLAATGVANYNKTGTALSAAAAITGAGALGLSKTSTAVSVTATLSGTGSVATPLDQMQYVSSAAAASNTVALPTHQAGDLIVAYAFRDGSTTVPSAAGGTWRAVGNSVGGTSCSSRTEVKLAVSSSETAGTWTNATGVTVVVYRGCAGLATPHNAGSGSGTTITYPSLSIGLQLGPDPQSWIARFAGARAATNLLTNTPAGYTGRNGVATECRIIDSNAGVGSAPTSTTQTIGPTSAWHASTGELAPMGTTLLSSLTNSFSGAFDSNWTAPVGGSYTISGGILTLNGGSFDSAPVKRRWINDSATVKVLTATGGNTIVFAVAVAGLVLGWQISDPDLGSDQTQPYILGIGLVGTPLDHTSGNYYRVTNTGVAGNITWQYSANGTSWTTAHSMTVASLQTGSHFLGGQSYISVDGSNTDGNFEIDSINIAP